MNEWSLDETETTAISVLLGLLVVAFVLWLLDWADTSGIWDDIIRRIQWRILGARHRARRRRLEAKVADLTGAGSEQFVQDLFPAPTAALFDGGSGLKGTGRQITEWQPYDLQKDPGIETPEELADPWIEVRGIGGWARWAVDGPVRPGDRLHPPPPSDWFARL